MIFGRTKVNRYVWLFISLMIVVPLFCYYMATIKQGHVKPFPHATLTTTACFYPQDIVFRFFMLFGSSFISLIFYLFFRWINYQCKRVGYPGQYSKFAFILCQFSVILYGITVGTIDQKGTGSLHGPCAVLFFFIWVATVVRTTYFLMKIRNFDTSVMSHGSLLFKKIVAAYLSLVWIYCFAKILMENQSEKDDEDIYGVIIQWNSVFCISLWVLSWVKQWKNIGFCLWRKNMMNIEN